MNNQAEARRIGVLGGGSWGTTAAKVIAENIRDKPQHFHQEVLLWIFDEKVHDKNLSDIINSEHTNPKYLPDISLPNEIRAVTDILQVGSACDILVFVTPHEFLVRTIEPLKGKTKKGAIGVSLTKGAFFQGASVTLVTEKINEMLGIPVCALMGANIATEVARGGVSECTLGYVDESAAAVLLQVFNSNHFRVSRIRDRGAVEICGVLKNVVAVGCGLVAGSGAGINTVVMLIRFGLLEMVRFSLCLTQCREKKAENPERAHTECKNESMQSIPRVFFESSGVADLIVTCFSGRNFRFSKLASERKQSIEEVEKTEMGGQKLQGYSTAKELKSFLEESKMQGRFPFLYSVCAAAQDISKIPEILDACRTTA